MYKRNKEKQRRYQREWMRKRRKEWFDANGPCKSCGSWNNLELDHIDPEHKITHAVWSWSEERRLIELAKCQALCETCHKKKTKEQVSTPILHGTHLGYTKGCRCRPCTDDHVQYCNEWPYSKGMRKRPNSILIPLNPNCADGVEGTL